MDWLLENWPTVLAWIAEFGAVLFCIHGFFGWELKANILVVVMLIIFVVIYSAILEGILPKTISCVPLIVMFAYCYRVFRRELIETISYYVLSIIYMGILEVISSYIIIPLQMFIEEQKLVMMFLDVVSLILSMGSVKMIAIVKKNTRLRFNSKKDYLYIMICAFCIIFLLLDYRVREELDQIYYLLFMALIIVICFYRVRMQKTQFELEKKKMELELQDIYGVAYKDLMFEVRRKQHDFVNQLGAVFSMHITATSLEDLIKRQSEYGTALLSYDQFDKILTGCNHPILAGYLYNKCVEFENRNVTVEYIIHVDMADCNLSLHEIIEILGILLTNAAESGNIEEDQQKVIKLICEETNESLKIEISNLSPCFTSADIEKIFEKGYSSKGDNRGIGLSRIKELAKKSKSEIVVENYMKEERNWVSFKVIVPK